MFTKSLCIDAKNFDAKNLTPTYNKVVVDLKCDYEKAKSNTINLLNQIWNFEPFYRTPLVEIGDSLIPFSETAIIYQMWEGLYWDIRYTLRGNGETFMTQFGTPFERYIQEITAAAVTASNESVLFLNEFLYKYKSKDKASTDCYCRIGNVLIAIEVKAKSPHSSTLTGVNREAIDIEVNELIVAPVIQTATRLKEINSSDSDIDEDKTAFFSGIEQTIVLSVCMEKVQPIGELLMISDTKLEDHLSQNHIVAYHNVSIEDFEVICNLIETSPYELPEILTSWFSNQRKDPRNAVILANYLPHCGKKYTCSKYVSALFENTLSEISLKTFGKDITTRLNL